MNYITTNIYIYIMTRFLILIIIVVLLTWLIFRSTTYERFTSEESNEAIANLASLYNDKHLTVNKIQLGGKWLLSGTGNDDWLRFKDPNTEKYHGGIAVGKLYVDNAGGELNAKLNSLASGLQNSINNVNNRVNEARAYADQQIQNSRINCDWSGWRLSHGVHSNDDYRLYCNNGKVTDIRKK